MTMIESEHRPYDRNPQVYKSVALLICRLLSEALDTSHGEAIDLFSYCFQSSLVEELAY